MQILNTFCWVPPELASTPLSPSQNLSHESHKWGSVVVKSQSRPWNCTPFIQGGRNIGKGQVAELRVCACKQKKPFVTEEVTLVSSEKFRSVKVQTRVLQKGASAHASLMCLVLSAVAACPGKEEPPGPWPPNGFRGYPTSLPPVCCHLSPVLPAAASTGWLSLEVPCCTL